MNVAQLIDRLEMLIESELINEGTEVRLAYQPNYPLEAHLAQVVSRAEVTENMVDEYMDAHECDRDAAEESVRANHGPDSLETQDIVYIAAGGDIGYGLRACWS